MGIATILLGIIISGASAYIYQQKSFAASQNIVEIVSITLQSLNLGDINEGQTIIYTKSEAPILGEAVSVTTTTAPVYLHFTSNLDSVDDYYETFNINIIYDSTPHGGSGSGTAGTLSITSHDLTTPVILDVPGTWVFDLSVETTANPVDVNTQLTVSILVEAKNTN